MAVVALEPGMSFSPKVSAQANSIILRVNVAAHIADITGKPAVDMARIYEDGGRQLSDLRVGSNGWFLKTAINYLERAGELYGQAGMGKEGAGCLRLAQELKGPGEAPLRKVARS